MRKNVWRVQMIKCQDTSQTGEREKSTGEARQKTKKGKEGGRSTRPAPTS